MLLLIRLFILLTLLTTCQVSAQTTDVLRQKIQQIIAGKNGIVGVAISGNDSGNRDTLTINGNHHFPLQSVFKFHIALVMLAEIDRETFSLDQKIKISKKEMVPDLYSPIRDKYPGGVTLPISKILAYTVSQSDNIGCDVLLRLLGGPEVVDTYFRKHKFSDISIKINEETQQANWDLQFQNWSTPVAANDLLAAVYSNRPTLLSQKSHAFLWKIMRETTTGKNRLRGQLPSGTLVAHKTGLSKTNKDGITAATNDMEIVFLPDGRYFFISVFVADSQESTDTNEKIIADIAKATWDYFRH